MMSKQPEQKKKSQAGALKCIVRSVADELSRERGLEAVTINRFQDTISVATFEESPESDLVDRVAGKVQKAEEVSRHNRCGILSGKGTCQTCETPLSEQEKRTLALEHKGGSTTIARPPGSGASNVRFWRHVSWPKVVQRDVEFLEHAEEIEEWKPQLVAAILCGVFGLGAWSLGESPSALAGYLLAYLAGAWYTVQEVWERLQKRRFSSKNLLFCG